MNRPTTNNPTRVFSNFFLIALGYLAFVFVGPFERLFPTPLPGYLIRSLVLTSVVLIFLMRRRTAGVIDRICGKCWARLPAWPAMVYALLFLAILLPAFLLRLQIIHDFPISVKQGDMLPLVEKACLSLLNHEPVYKMYWLPHSLYLTYLPGLWMAYLPAVAWNFDLRLLGMVYLLVVVGIHAAFFWQGIRQPSRGIATVSAAAAASIVLFLYTPPFVFFTVNGHAYPFWMYLSVWAYFMWKKQWSAAAVMLGLIIASRHFGIIFLPFVLIYTFRSLPWRQQIKPALLMTAVIGLLCLPFYVQSPRAFLWEPLHEYSIIGQFYFDLPDRQHEVLNTIGFSNLFYLAGQARWLSAVQWSLLAALTVFAWFKIKTLPQLLVFCATALFIFCAFSIIPWVYLYIPVLLLLSLAAIIDAVDSEDPPDQKPAAADLL